MVQQKKDTRWMVQLALMAAIIVVLANTPLGMIQLPIIKATTIHIPVILGAILLGPMAGAILGGVFGICSMVSNTVAPVITSFAFSPFLSTTGLSGAVKAIWVCLGCRILIGVVSGWLWIALQKAHVPDLAALPVVGFVGSMVNTIGVMGLIYLLFGEQYAAAGGQSFDLLLGVIMGVVAVNGIPEALIAAVLTLAVGKVLLGIFGRRGAKTAQQGTV